MTQPSSTTYSPVVDPRDPSSVPLGLGPRDEAHLPLRRSQRAPSRSPPWLRHLRDAHRLVTNFCISDRLLLKWDAQPGAAEAWVRRLGPDASLTLDVPFYAFMTAAQKARALSRALAATTRGLHAWDARGIETIPLVKGLGPWDWDAQLELAAQVGLRRVAFYARETLLEGESPRVGAFVRRSRAARLRPVLLGCFRPRPPAEGLLDAAAIHHYVLARRGRFLNRAGRPVPVPAGAYSDVLGRFVLPGQARELGSHNFGRTRRRFSGAQGILPRAS